MQLQPAKHGTFVSVEHEWAHIVLDTTKVEVP